MPRSLLGLPKAHLHVHLEGTIRPATLVDIAARHGVAAPLGAQDGARYAFRDLASFFVDYQRVRDCLNDADDFRRIAYELCQDEAAQGVRYAEVTFSPAYHALRLGDWDMPVATILEGFAQGESDFGIKCRLILDHSRRRSYELAEQTLAAAVRFRDRGVIGLGLGGPEADYPPEPFAPLLDDATLAQIARASVGSSYLDNSAKQSIAGEIDEWLAAEGEGFEPSRGFDSPNPLSRRAH